MALGTFPIKIISMAKMVTTTILSSKISFPKMDKLHSLSLVLAEATLLEMISLKIVELMTIRWSIKMMQPLASINLTLYMLRKT
jgi:hypothetical protein